MFSTMLVAAGFKTQAAFAASVGLNGPKLTNVLNGTRRPQISELTAMARVLNVPMPNMMQCFGFSAMSDNDIPEIGSTWEHTSGRIYTVIHIANMPDTPRYPRTVVSQDAVGAVWTRPVSDWHRSMTLASDKRVSRV